MLLSLLAIAVLLVAGAVVAIAFDGRALLLGLALHTAALAGLAVSSAGWVFTGALFIGNVTAVGVMSLAWRYGAVTVGEPTRRVGRAPKLGRRAGGRTLRERRGPNRFLLALAVALAAVVAWGLSGKPISGVPEAASGVPSFVAYWSLAAGLVILLLNTDFIKIAGALMMMANGGQVMYLMSATNLDVLLLAVSTLVVVALSLGVAYLAALAARLPAQDALEPVRDSPLDVEPNQWEPASASEDGAC